MEKDFDPRDCLCFESMCELCWADECPISLANRKRK